MEPRIQYAKTSDGVSIAHWAIGEGRPLVYMPPMPWCQIEREWAIPEPLRHLLSGKSYVYADRGETALKGFDDAARLYEVRWQP